MAAQEPSASISPAVVSDRRMDNDPDSETRDSASPSTDGNMSHEFDVSNDSVAAQKHGVKVNEGFTPGVAASDDLSSQSNGRSWKNKALQFKACRRLVSALTGRDPEELREFHPTNRSPRPWRTTLIRFGPLSGIFCMFLAVASIVASLGILAGSDKQPTPSWSVPPSTYLAIFTALANLSMRYAAIQGVVIAWWYRARKGSTVSRLHWDYHAGTSLRGALTAGRHMGLLGLACIVSTVVVIDGPLLQRSTSVVIATYADQPVHLDFRMAPELPHGWSGIWYHNPPFGFANWFNETVPAPHGGNVSNFVDVGPDFRIGQYVAKPWLGDSPFEGIVQGCPGVCNVKLKAPAVFATTCTSQQIPANFHHAYITKGMEHGYTAPPLEDYALVTSMNLVLGDKETVNLVTGTWTGKDCSGVLTMNMCTLEAGIGNYNFTIHSDGSAIMESESALLPEFVAFANNTAADHTWDPITRSHPSTLGGVLEMVFQEFEALYYYYGGGDTPLSAASSVFPIEEYMTRDTIASKCPSFGRDPKDDIIRAFNKLMVRMGAHAATLPASEILPKMDPGVIVNATVTGYAVGPNVFHTEYGYFVGAAVVELICIALVLPTYWGWWKFGRPGSFSPLEMAKAFEAPLLAEYDSNSSGRDLAKAKEGAAIQYGATASDSKFDGFKLAFAHPDSVTPPQRGSRYENH